MDLYHDEYTTYYHYDPVYINWDAEFPPDSEDEETDSTAVLPPPPPLHSLAKRSGEVIELFSSDDEDSVDEDGENEETDHQSSAKRQRLCNGDYVNEQTVLENDKHDDDENIDYENGPLVIIEDNDNPDFIQQDQEQDQDYDEDDVAVLEDNDLKLIEYVNGYEITEYPDQNVINYEISYEIEATDDQEIGDEYQGETLENETGTYRCPLCPKEVVSKYNLKRHMMIHTGEFSVKCHICNKGFRELSDLRKHLKVHEEGTKFFECSTCLRSYKSFKTNRCFFCDGEEDDDMPPPTSYEDPNKLYQCFLCSKKQLTTLELKQHLRRDHPATSRTPWNPNANGTDASESIEAQHSCNVCSKSFRNKQFLMLHALTHANNRVERVS